MNYRVSDHAVSRLRERHLDSAGLSDIEARQVLLTELDRGIPFGAQCGTGADHLLLLPCELVAAIRRDEDTLTVKTILTKELAIANMQARGILLASSRANLLFTARVDSPLDLDRFLETAERDRLQAARDSSLRRLAEEHFRLGIGRKKRNDLLRQDGFDPAGHDGGRYRTFFREVQLAFYSEPREARKRGAPKTTVVQAAPAT